METKQKVNGISMLEVFLKVEVHSNGFIGTLLDTYTYILDVLWGQLIKLAQVASTTELLENQQNDRVFFKIIPSHFL